MTRDGDPTPAAGAEPVGPDGLTVGGAASMVGVSVRTLHHWDQIGLVRPSDRTDAGYRVYVAEDVARIHRVLVYRELGLPLAEIGRVLDDPTVDARDHLRRQRELLTQQADRLRTMINAVDRILDAAASGIQLSPEQQVELFGQDWQPAWVDEAERQWGTTPQWQQYADRSAGRTPEDWRELATDVHDFQADLVAAYRAGTIAGSAAADALAERHRASLEQHFTCTHAMQACLARRIVDDPGFSAHYDGFEPGLAVWLRDVIFAHVAAHGIDPETAVWE